MVSNIRSSSTLLTHPCHPHSLLAATTLPPAELTPVGSKLVADFYQDGEERQISLSGDFWGGSANIKDDKGNALAHIERNMMNVNEAVGDQQMVCHVGGEGG